MAAGGFRRRAPVAGLSATGRAFLDLDGTGSRDAGAGGAGEEVVDGAEDGVLGAAAVAAEVVHLHRPHEGSGQVQLQDDLALKGGYGH